MCPSDFTLNSAGILATRDILVEETELLKNLKIIVRQFLTKPEEVFELEKAIDGNAPVAYIILLFLKYWTSYNSNPTFNQLVNKLRAINLNDTAEKFETNRDFLLQVSEPINANIQAVHQRHKTATGASNTQVKLNHQCIILTFVVLITAVIIGVYIACYN